MIFPRIIKLMISNHKQLEKMTLQVVLSNSKNNIFKIKTNCSDLVHKYLVKKNLT